MFHQPTLIDGDSPAALTAWYEGHQQPPYAPSLARSDNHLFMSIVKVKIDCSDFLSKRTMIPMRETQRHCNQNYKNLSGKPMRT